MSEKQGWPIDEFVSIELIEDEEKGVFTIILRGQLRYSDLIAVKVGEITVTKEDMGKWGQS